MGNLASFMLGCRLRGGGGAGIRTDKLGRTSGVRWQNKKVTRDRLRAVTLSCPFSPPPPRPLYFPFLNFSLKLGEKKNL